MLIFCLYDVNGSLNKYFFNWFDVQINDNNMYHVFNFRV